MSSDVCFVENYLDSVYVKKNMFFNPFSTKFSIFHGEFGETLGWPGLKVQAEKWMSFFEIVNIKINNTTNAKGHITCDYTESVRQISTFKKTTASKNVFFTVNNLLHFGLEASRITYFHLAKNIDNLTMQLAEHNHMDYDLIKRAWIFDHASEMHVNVLSAHLKANNIHLRRDDICCLCQELMALGSKEKTSLQRDRIQEEFRSKDWGEIHDIIYSFGLTRLVAEVFTLLRSTSQQFSDTSAPRFDVPLCFLDESRYLL